MTDDAQPDEGQGGSPFDSYLQTVPDDARQAAESWFKDTSKGLNSKLEEGAEFRKQWEPYSQIDNLPPPDQLEELLSFLGNEEAVDQWVAQQAEAKGFSKAEAQEMGEEALLREEGLSEQKIQEIIDQRAQEQLQPFEQRLEEMEFARGADLEAEAIRTELGRLEAEHKKELSEDERADVLKLGMEYAFDNKGQELPVGDVSWIAKGFEDYRDIGTRANRAFIEQASAQPAAAVTAGGVATQKPITSYEDAREALRERLRATATQ